MFRVRCRALRVPRHAAFSTSRRVADTGRPPSITRSIDALLTDLGSPGDSKPTRPAPPPPPPSTAADALSAQPLKPKGGLELDVDAADSADAADAVQQTSPPTGPEPSSTPPTPDGGTGKTQAKPARVSILPYTLHVHAGQNNTMLTLAAPGGRVPKKGWVSSGMLRFRKANRASYEAGYQCATWMFRRIADELYELNKEPGQEDAPVPARNAPVNRKDAKAAAAAQAAAAKEALTKDLKVNIALTLKFDGFGPGRDAVFRALLTQEGEPTAKLVRWITDCTPIKIGGTRAKKMRRL
ncbi:hypothetical protein AURDEDRAFT_110685, partial [Auricularia subglabra TFB-10046 SS5]